VTLSRAQGLAIIREYAAANRSLAVVVTTRPGHDDPQVAVVNAAVVDHPVSGQPVVALVARRGAKLDNLRVRPRMTLVFRHGWEWVAVRGPVELSGPDDPHPGIAPEKQRLLLRTIYLAAGGEHPDLDAYDTSMHEERRCAALVEPERIWTNPPGSEHKDTDDNP
jgi:hypothetical protein